MNTKAQNKRVRIAVYLRPDGEWQADTDTNEHAVGRSRREALLLLAEFLDLIEAERELADAHPENTTSGRATGLR